MTFLYLLFPLSAVLMPLIAIALTHAAIESEGGPKSKRILLLTPIFLLVGILILGGTLFSTTQVAIPSPGMNISNQEVRGLNIFVLSLLVLQSCLTYGITVWTTLKLFGNKEIINEEEEEE